MPFLALSSLERETLGLCYRVEAIAIREVLAAVLALEFLRDTDCEEPARWEEALTRFQASWIRAHAIAPDSSELDAFRDRGDDAFGAQSVIADLQPRYRGFILNNLLFAEERELQIDRLRLEACRGRLVDLLSTLTQASRIFPVTPLLQTAGSLLTRARELRDIHTANQEAIEEARAAQASIEEFIGLPGLSTPPSAERVLDSLPVESYLDDVPL